MSKIKTHIVLCFTFLLLASCTSRKKTVATTESLLTEALLEQVKANEVPWQWFTAKLNIKPEEGVVTNLSGQIRMQRDSVIWVSVSAMLGMEALRLKMTPDSVFVLNKLENTYLATSFEELKNRFGTQIAFSQLQNLLLGNCFWILGTGDKTRTEDERCYRLATGHNQLWVRKNDFKTARAQVSDNYFQLLVTYDPYQTLGSSLLPTKLELALKGMYNFAGQLEYASITLNQPTSFPFKVSQTMQKVAL